MTKFVNPTIQSLALMLIEKHGGTKDLLILAGSPNQPHILVQPLPEYRKMIERRLEEYRKEVSVLEDLITFYRVLDAIPDGRMVEE